MRICWNNLQYMWHGNRFDIGPIAAKIQYDTNYNEQHKSICNNDCLSLSRSTIHLHGLTAMGAYTLLHFYLYYCMLYWYIFCQLLYKKVWKAKYSCIFYAYSQYNCTILCSF